MDNKETNKAADLRDADLIWEPVSVEHVIQDKWIDLRKVEYRFPDGTTFSPYYNYSRRSYVVIVASDEEGKYLCVRQYRHGIGEVTTEFVAGGIECENGREYITKADAITTREDALAAAKRELEEETGYSSDEWEHLITVPSAATMADNYAYIYRAKNCRRTHEQHTDSTEFLRVRKYSPDEIEELIAAGKFQQAMHIMPCTSWPGFWRRERRIDPVPKADTALARSAFRQIRHKQPILQNHILKVAEKT